MSMIMFRIIITMVSITRQTYCSQNLPPAFAEAASSRQVTSLACLCGRKKIAKGGEFLLFCEACPALGLLIVQDQGW